MIHDSWFMILTVSPHKKGTHVKQCETITGAIKIPSADSTQQDWVVGSLPKAFHFKDKQTWDFPAWPGRGRLRDVDCCGGVWEVSGFLGYLIGGEKVQEGTTFF